MKRAVITIGLGFGDCGKGATVDFLCRHLGASLVVRYSGGSQSGHNVELPDGRRHTFSQFGAGTLAGVPAHLGPRVIINPSALPREADHLRSLGIDDPFALLTVHPQCLVSTFWHQTVNQLRELARGAGRHGSCGHGIGETRSYWLRYGDDAIFARDLQDAAVLNEKLELLRQRLFLDLQEFIERVPTAELREYDLLTLAPAATSESLLEVGSSLRLQDRVPFTSGTLIFEGAQGVLLDEWRGFHPHTTWSTVTAHHALEMALECGVEELCVLGLTRAYTTRHGAGPFPTYDAALTAALPDPGNPHNPWQGGFRVGWLDLPLLKYAAAVAGSELDGLAVSNLDQLETRHVKVCTEYAGVRLEPSPGPSLAWQARLTDSLRNARPLLHDTTPTELLGMLGEIAPVVIEGRGPTHTARSATSLPFRKRKGTAPHGF
ncbi:MAG TPA: adenylosuccinate synthetase [Gemmataceae bacterium]|nr:adenylosuccinate synthetase [Gemmataceae bacterium]